MEIKNFIYLDEEKLYSYSSQIFKGLAKEISEKKSNGSDYETIQKIGIATGKQEGIIEKLQTEILENRLIHDDLYDKLEESMITHNKIVKVEELSKEQFEGLKSLKVLKLKSKVKIYNREATEVFLEGGVSCQADHLSNSQLVKHTTTYFQ